MIKQSLIILFTVIGLMAISQNNFSETKYSKAVAFAKTEPLRDLTLKLSPNKSDAIPISEEVKNRFNVDKWENTDKTARPGEVQTKDGSIQTRGPIRGFNGQGGTGFVPPDTDGDVSETHFVQMVNSKYNVYLKDGTKLIGPLDLSTIWSQLPGGPWGNSGDPIVLYDEQAQKWILTQFAPRNDYSENYELFAVSETSDPTGAYYLYAFEFGNIFNDYPKMGVWSDAYYATYNMFQRNGNSFNFVGAAITAVERDKMIIGDPDAQMITTPGYSQGYIPSYYSTMPADIDGENYPEGTPCPIMYINWDQEIEMWNFTPDWENPGNSTLIKQTPNIVVPTFVETPDDGGGGEGFISQPNTSQKLDALGRMIMNRLAYRKFDTHESLVVNHSILTAPEGGGSYDRSGIRWYEFRRNDGIWEVYQQGTYSPDDGINRWMGSIAMNANGDIALGYSVSNATEVYPSIRYTGRRAGDPLGEMTIEEIEIKTGTNSQSHWRWGDYSCMNVDPANDTSFWFTTEYNGWSTWIAEFDFSPIQNATAEAGEDAFICRNQQFHTNGSGTGVLSIHWTTDGDGFFAPANLFNSTYIRGTQDMANGGCTLTMTVTGYDGVEVSDQMYLHITPYVNAGEDAAISVNESFQLMAEGTESGSIQWTTSGDGIFSDPQIMQPIYTPGPQDISNMEVQLSVSVLTTEPCADAVTDAMTLGFLVGTEEIANQSDIEIYPNPADGIFQISFNQLRNDQELSYTVFNSKGQEVFRELITGDQTHIKKSLDMSGFLPGVYFIQIRIGENISTRKLILK